MSEPLKTHRRTPSFHSCYFISPQCRAVPADPVNHIPALLRRSSRSFKKKVVMVENLEERFHEQLGWLEFGRGNRGNIGVKLCRHQQEQTQLEPPDRHSSRKTHEALFPIPEKAHDKKTKFKKLAKYSTCYSPNLDDQLIELRNPQESPRTKTSRAPLTPRTGSAPYTSRTPRTPRKAGCPAVGSATTARLKKPKKQK